MLSSIGKRHNKEKMLTRVTNYLEKLPVYTFIPLIGFGLSLYSLLFNFITLPIRDWNIVFTDTYAESEITWKIFVFMPFLETLIIQFFPILFLKEANVKSERKIILFSAFLFSAIHLYSLFYMIATFIDGIVFAWCYLLYQKSKKFSPFLTVYLIHLLCNTGIFFLMKIIK